MLLFPGCVVVLHLAPILYDHGTLNINSYHVLGYGQTGSRPQGPKSEKFATL